MGWRGGRQEVNGIGSIQERPGVKLFELACFSEVRGPSLYFEGLSVELSTIRRMPFAPRARVLRHVTTCDR